MARYIASRDDEAFRDLTADGNPDDNPFEIAIALRDISDEYLSVLMADNQGDSSEPFLRQVEFEVERRAADKSKTANWIASAATAMPPRAIQFAVFDLSAALRSTSNSTWRRNGSELSP